jgi:hypothetical protein
MAKAARSVQAPLRKFLYDGRVPVSETLDSLSFNAAQSHVKTEFEAPQGAALGSEASAGSTAAPVLPSGAQEALPSNSDCVLIESKSTPVKAREPDLLILDAATASRHFQDSWAAKLPWAEAVMGADGRITQVWCKICSDIEGREKLFVPKIDSLYKHAGRRKALVDMGKVRRGEHYYLGTNQHVKNECIFFAKGGQTIIQQVLKGVTKERKWKTIQMKCVFHLMTQGQPMADFSAMQDLLVKLNVADLPKRHWGELAGWDFSHAMAKVCSDRLKADIAKARFISVSADEVTAVDNSQWLSIHVYYNVNFSRQSHMLCIRRLYSEANANNLTNMIVEQLSWHGGISEMELVEKMIYFGADGAAVFQGSRNGVIQQLKEKHTPFVIGVHDFAHRTNLAVEALSNLPVVQRLKSLYKSLHSYFSASPKRHLEFTKLVEVVET